MWFYMKKSIMAVRFIVKSYASKDQSIFFVSPIVTEKNGVDTCDNHFHSRKKGRNKSCHAILLSKV